MNDAFGHAVGDELLVEAGRRLRASVRLEDTVARNGGDEFTILQVGLEQPKAAHLLAERIVEAFRKPFSAGGNRMLVETSVGIAVAPIDGLDPASLMQKADQALYRTKAEGKNGYRFLNEDLNEACSVVVRSLLSGGL